MNREGFATRGKDAVDFAPQGQRSIQQSKILEGPRLPFDQREAKLQTITAGFGLPAGAFEVQELGVWR